MRISKLLSVLVVAPRVGVYFIKASNEDGAPPDFQSVDDV